MNLDHVEKVAEAVLYEGYMLYPYRPSSIKNQQRWNFGVLYPPSYCVEQTGSEICTMQTECLLRANPTSRLTMTVRFLQIVRRSIGLLRTSGEDNWICTEPAYDLVERLELSDRVYVPGQEAVECELTYAGLDPESLSSLSPSLFTFLESKTIELLHNEQGHAIGVIQREWETLNGSVEFASECCRDGIVKVTVRVNNLTSLRSFEPADRDGILQNSLVSAHTILGVEQGEFLSLLDPPADVEGLTAGCQNIGTWPVLSGEHGEAILSSPIILYDYPQIAPESAGNLFDSTEIDEILSLRILTLTESEKQEMRQSDDRTREILERTENMPEEQFMKLHGVLRGLSRPGEELR